MVRYFHVTLTNNWNYIQKNGLQVKTQKRGIGGDDTPAIYLFRTREEAEDGVTNWLGDELPEEEALMLLAVDLPLDWHLEDDPELNLSAVRSLHDIPAN